MSCWKFNEDEVEVHGVVCLQLMFSFLVMLYLGFKVVFFCEDYHDEPNV